MICLCEIEKWTDVQAYLKAISGKVEAVKASKKAKVEIKNELVDTDQFTFGDYDKLIENGIDDISMVKLLTEETLINMGIDNISHLAQMLIAIADLNLHWYHV